MPTIYGWTVIPRVYLDYNATAPARPEALAAFADASGVAANPSSVHAEGRRARDAMERARAEVAALVEARPEHVVFTSGGTEALNMALRPGLRCDGTAIERLLVPATEHAAVLNGHGFDPAAVTILPVGRDGVLVLGALRAALDDGGPALLALQAANNETGVLQPVGAAATLVHARGGVVLSDAVQAAGRLPCGGDVLAADLLVVSGHKLGGLPGSGALIVRRDGLDPAPALVRGGGQERGLRAGTENVPAIAAFGAACRAARGRPEADRLRALRDRFEVLLARLAPCAVVFGADAERLPNTSAFAIRGATAERLMIGLDLCGIAVSSGSACASGKVGRSHVLEAMGVEPDLREGAIRVSFGWGSTAADVDAAMEALGLCLRRMSVCGLRSAA